ncbi:MAG TPA: hypothetical protein VLK84_12335 [Longimicrobium sp.]|nr:hypothetical protein [Longimicrobium sp.]
MQRMACQARVEQPERPEAFVSEPQYLMYWLQPGEAVVEAYFMANCAVDIEDPHAVAVGRNVSLRYFARSPSGAFTACESLRKVVFTFVGLTQRSYSFSLRELRSKHPSPADT